MGIDGQRHAPAAYRLGKGPGTHSTGGSVGPRAGLDECGESRHHRESIPGPDTHKIVEGRPYPL
jgi:hypothetical protein